jgi:hypothetical protein
MSLRAIIDLTLQIDSFRNIGMYNQGVYYLEYSIYYMIGDIKYYANPYSMNPIIPRVEEDEISKKKDFHSLTENEIAGSPPTYRTKVFYIRYKDELVIMDEICQFRAEMDTEIEHDFSSAEYFLEANLKFKK